jgi:ketosteroid isomerase-like protein
VSRANIDLVYRAIDAVNAREVPDFLATDFRIEGVNTAVTDRTYVGPEGWREWMDELCEAFGEGARHEVDEIVAEGDDYVVAVASFVGRGAASDAPLQLRWVGVTWFRDGQVTRSSGFLTKREALKAVGLEA